METVLSVQDFFIDGPFLILDVIVIIFFDQTMFGYIGVFCTLLVMVSGIVRPVSWVLRERYLLLRPSDFEMGGILWKSLCCVASLKGQKEAATDAEHECAAETTEQTSLIMDNSANPDVQTLESINIDRLGRHLVRLG